MSAADSASRRAASSNAEPVRHSRWKQAFRRRLLTWFEKHRRDLPWRRTRDPYAIWVSEVMLQQTQVATVVEYYERFLERFPDVVALADAPESDVLRLWEGLGYYRRARQLHAAARTIRDTHNGRFPDRFEDVLALPGVGRYTAGAVLSIAHDSRLAIVEANTIRLYARLLNHQDDVTTTRSQNRFWEFAESLLPRRNVGAFNQALMELGATVCTPRTPDCPECPLRAHCEAFAAGAVDRTPAPKRKQNFTQQREAALVVRRRGRVLLRQCQPGERWSGLWDFPRVPLPEAPTAGGAKKKADGSQQADDEAILRNAKQLTGLTMQPGATLLTLKHGVTRYRITLHCREATLVDPPRRLPTNLRWTPISELPSVPLNTTGRQLAERLE